MYCKRFGFTKGKPYYSWKKKQKKQDLILFAMKLTTKVSYPDNAKEDYQSYLNKTKKIINTIKNNYSKIKLNRKLKH